MMAPIFGGAASRDNLSGCATPACRQQESNPSSGVAWIHHAMPLQKKYIKLYDWKQILHT